MGISMRAPWRPSWRLNFTWLGRMTPAAKDHLFTAYYSYLAWGAKAKVEDLVKRYPEWLPPGRDG